VIQAVHVLQYVHRVSVGLELVVPDSDDPYRAALQKLVHTLRIGEAEFIDAERPPAAALAHASCFVSASSAERVPGLLDAVAAGVPTIATFNVPSAGSIVLPPHAGPLLVAEALLAIINDSGLRSALVVAGRDSTGHGS
jgi:hypothetical protein